MEVILDIRQPIIVFGTGRSGTTVFHEMLCEHPRLVWLSPLCNRFPDNAVPNRILMMLASGTPLRRMLLRRFPPDECYGFWEHHAKGFSAPCRDLVSDDLSNGTRGRLQNALSGMSGRQHDRLLMKITGWPRLGYLSTLFEHPRYIHVIRDGRAVANSLLNIGFWQGWAGPGKWRWGPLSRENEALWLHYDHSFVVLAALQWLILMEAAEKAKESVGPENVYELRYETLCSGPVEALRGVAEFAGLEWTPLFERRLARYHLRNTNDKWIRDLTLRQQADLNAVLGPGLVRYGYA